MLKLGVQFAELSYNYKLLSSPNEWLIKRLSRVPILPASFKSSNGNGNHEAGTRATEGVNGSAQTIPPDEGEPGADCERALTGFHPEADCDAVVVSVGPIASEAAVECTGSSDGASPSQATPRDGETTPCEQAPSDPKELSAPDPSANADIKGNVEAASSLQVLLRLASGARFFRSCDGRHFARVPVGSRHEIYGLKSAAFRDWLIEGHFSECREIPSHWVIRRVLTALEARARFGGGTPSVFIRVGHDGAGNSSPFFIDLGDSSGRAIEICLMGWSIVDRPGAHFRRPEGLLALPTPSREGSIELLRSYVNLSDRDFRLMIVWMAASLRPVGPYPVLALYGEQAAAKSTLAQVVRLVR